MKCPSCDSANVNVFFSESITCHHCKKENDISFNVCSDCGMIWKSIHGELIDGSSFSDKDLHTVMVGSMVGTNKNFGDLIGEVKFKSMSELVHSCIKCGGRAYEVNEKLFKCSVCNFEWEII